MTGTRGLVAAVKIEFWVPTQALRPLPLRPQLCAGTAKGVSISSVHDGVRRAYCCC